MKSSPNKSLEDLARDPRLTIRRRGAPVPGGCCVVYWMQRSQRGFDNPALDVAVHAANALNLPVVAYFAPVPFYPHANLRAYAFLAQGIPDIASDLAVRNVGFVLRRYPDHSLLRFCDEVNPALVVGDENPLREPNQWRTIASRKLKVPLWTVDSDVIVPSKLFEKAQYAAYHFRPRLKSLLDQFLLPCDNPKARVKWTPPNRFRSLPVDFDILDEWPIDRSVSPVSSFKGGSSEARRLLKEFLADKLRGYAERRNKPELDATTRLSPYLHFGHLSPLTIMLAARNADAPAEDKDSLFNELVVWRELAINLCWFNPLYDSFEVAEPWAHRTLLDHAQDPRPVVYTERQLENAETHDELWNAAQRQMVTHGWMHNVMRMYWAKKILEWTNSPAQAHQIAIALNDKYFLDGRDPNGYAGVAWAILGKFDRPWFERPIFGKIRYMSQASTGKKFNSKLYIEQNSGPELQKALF
ncbi:MAG TPA: deoxyribodipyrimidine photo-lyase [Terriglobales bacterium]|nr:deoxyribodipyrimidine photo-lyase [Terriglobales bacterium]